MSNMNYAKLSLVSIAVIATILPARVSNAAQIPSNAVAGIQANADAIAKNAKAYLWKRTALETVNIAAGEKNIENAVKGDTDLEAKTNGLRQAVLSLRSAQASHNADKTVAAAERVSEECKALVK